MRQLSLDSGSGLNEKSPLSPPTDSLKNKSSKDPGSFHGKEESKSEVTCNHLEHVQIDEKKKPKVKELMMIRTIMPEGVNAVTAKGQWEQIELAVDSGATETVVGTEMLQSAETKPSWGSKNGVEYEVANGETIPNEGEKKFHGVTESGITRNITAQVCDVNKALLSVKKIVAAGNRVVFENEGSYIEDKNTKERLWLSEDRGMYMLKMWVRSSPF